MKLVGNGSYGVSFVMRPLGKRFHPKKQFTHQFIPLANIYDVQLKLHCIEVLNRFLFALDSFKTEDWEKSMLFNNQFCLMSHWVCRSRKKFKVNNTDLSTHFSHNSRVAFTWCHILWLQQQLGEATAPKKDRSLVVHKIYEYSLEYSNSVPMLGHKCKPVHGLVVYKMQTHAKREITNSYRAHTHKKHKKSDYSIMCIVENFPYKISSVCTYLDAILGWIPGNNDYRIIWDYMNWI